MAEKTCRECKPHEHKATCFSLDVINECPSSGMEDFVDLCERHATAEQEREALQKDLSEALKHCLVVIPDKYGKVLWCCVCQGRAHLDQPFTHLDDNCVVKKYELKDALGGR